MSSFRLPDTWARNGFVRHSTDPSTGAISREVFTPVHVDHPYLPLRVAPEQHDPPPLYVSPYAPTAFSQQTSALPSAAASDQQYPLHPEHCYSPTAFFSDTSHGPRFPQAPLPSANILSLPLSDRGQPPQTSTTANQHFPAIRDSPQSDRGGNEHWSWDRLFEQQIEENDTLRTEAIASLRHQEKQLDHDRSWQLYKVSRMQVLLEAAEVARPANTNAVVVTESTVVEMLEKRPDIDHPIFFDASSIQHAFGGFEGALNRLLAGKAESNPSLKLPIQNSKANEDAKSGELEEWHISDVRARLQTNDDSLHPVNGLDLTPLKPVLPRCLQDLTFMHDLAQPWREMKASARPDRKVAPKTHARLEKLIRSAYPWVTLAQVGVDGAALTLPHRDVDGLDTYLLCAQGIVGFIWLESPSAAVLNTFVAHPSTLPFGSQWRLMFLRPGQAVYFPAGLVHAVVRLPSTEKRPQEHTLLFGSHFLHPRCVVAMAQLCKQQMQSTASVNEDPYDTAIPYLARIGLFILANEDNIDQFGGEEVVNEYWKILSVCLPAPLVGRFG